MTQPPYVPPRDDDSTTTPVWPATQESNYSEASYVEPVSSVAVGPYSDQGQSTKDVAKDEAGNVKDTAMQQGQQVAGVAKEQAGAVKDTAVQQGQQVAGVAKEQVTELAAEASTHVKDLLSEGLSEVRNAAGSQQKRLATGIHSLADELGTMASKSDKSGPLTDYAKQLSHKGGEVAHYLENAEPAELLDWLRSVARRRPGVFLASSALAGVVVGRLTRSFAANKKDDSQAALNSSYTGTAGQSGMTVGTATPDYASTTDYAQTTDYSANPQYTTTESGLNSPYTQDVTTTGTGYGYSSDRGEYGVGETNQPYGTTGNEGTTR